jgi:hypothetical protein
MIAGKTRKIYGSFRQASRGMAVKNVIKRQENNSHKVVGRTMMEIKAKWIYGDIINLINHRYIRDLWIMTNDL